MCSSQNDVDLFLESESTACGQDRYFNICYYKMHNEATLLLNIKLISYVFLKLHSNVSLCTAQEFLDSNPFLIAG